MQVKVNKLEFFPLLTIMNNAAINTVNKFLCGHMFSFLLGAHAE